MTTRVTALVGFLGAGKTTMLRHLLENCETGVRIGVIANDVAQVNIDIDLVREVVHDSASGNIKSVQLDNGCACCTASGDLIESFEGLLKESGDKPFDHVIIEATGVAEAGQMRKVLEEFPSIEKGTSIVGNVVCVLDSNDFLNQYSSGEVLKERPDLTGIDDKEQDQQAKRLIVDLLVEQVESSDIVVLNKIDLIQEEPNKLEGLKRIIEELNPNAPVFSTSYGVISLSDLVTDVKQKEHKDTKDHSHTHDCEEHGCKTHHHHHDHRSKYGIESFTFKSDKPFAGPLLAQHVLKKMAAAQQGFSFPDLLQSKVDVEESNTSAENPFTQVLRSKGFLFLGAQPTRRMYWSHAGKLFSVSPQGMWDEETPARQELVFIGVDMNKEAILSLLNQALADN